ncbi:hypothetical protein K0651_00375 [Ornithinimicrobium sp. Arc0846-15]|nr:hypothetical protein [Ornithinimicrobium laminariae]
MSGLSRRVKIRRAANWLNLSTPLGLAVAKIGGGRLRRGPDALYLADLYRYDFPVVSAFTVGDVVISKHDLNELCARRPQLLEHEEAHSRQWAWCGGLPFLPLYVVSMGWSMARTGDRAARSVFERRAGLAKGGYCDVPVRPMLPVIRDSVMTLRGRLLGTQAAQTGERVGANP